MDTKAEHDARTEAGALDEARAPDAPAEQDVDSAPLLRDAGSSARAGRRPAPGRQRFSAAVLNPILNGPAWDAIFNRPGTAKQVAACALARAMVEAGFAALGKSTALARDVKRQLLALAETVR